MENPVIAEFENKPLIIETISRIISRYLPGDFISLNNI
jgi:hypothetical protein